MTFVALASVKDSLFSLNEVMFTYSSVLFQHGRSLVAVDHLFTLIASAAAKFSLEQLNHLIGFIYDVMCIFSSSEGRD